jgi:hypothetical protein
LDEKAKSKGRLPHLGYTTKMDFVFRILSIAIISLNIKHNASRQIKTIQTDPGIRFSQETTIL